MKNTKRDEGQAVREKAEPFMALLRKTKTSFLFKLTCYVWRQCSFCWIIIFNTIYCDKPLLFSVDLLHFLMLFIRRGRNFAWSLSSKTRVCFGANAWELMSTDYSCCAHMHREFKITCKICRCTAEHQRAGHGNIGPIEKTKTILKDEKPQTSLRNGPYWLLPFYCANSLTPQGKAIVQKDQYKSC